MMAAGRTRDCPPIWTARDFPAITGRGRHRVDLGAGDPPAGHALAGLAYRCRRPERGMSMAASHGHGRWAPAVLGDAGEDDSGCYVLGVRETTDACSWSLMFMECCDADDEQEVALGMDTYCLVVDPGQATFYGGVRECELACGRLRLVLTEHAAAALGVPAALDFALTMSPGQQQLISRGLRRVLTSGRRDAIPRLLDV